MCISAPKLSKRIMKYRIKKETKTTLPTYGVRLHFLFASYEGTQVLYQAIATWTVTLLWM